MVVNRRGTPSRARSHASSTTSQPRNRQRAAVAQGAPPSSVPAGSGQAAAGGIANIDPVVVAQIAAVGPALAAIAAVLSGQQPQGGTAQPEREPDEDSAAAEERQEDATGDRDASDKKKKNGKIDLRQNQGEDTSPIAQAQGAKETRNLHEASGRGQRGGGRAKEKPKNPGTFAGKSGIVCFECGGDGHTAAFHGKYLRNKPADEGIKEASAQLADADNSEEDEAVETVGADADDDENEDDE
ncbi:unnamed protein product [Phytophthora fragariaefolia]|uniref:Unnamed protein product n=1 Tax=Phytophthora fragariaefolia TaxID=1490495 RepID=A0A9W7CV80_9STRA|nr:unnamed protein product [Phytophthora fragariaefolia]